MEKKIIITGSGNAALCAGIAALEKGAEVLIVEKASKEEAGGNSRYTAGAMRFVYNANEDLYPLLLNLNDERIAKTDFGSYSKDKFTLDMLRFNEGRPINLHQQLLINNSYDTIKWLAGHNVKFEPIYSRQMFEKDGRYIFWGGLTLAAKGEGVGLVDSQLKRFIDLGGKIQYRTEAYEISIQDNRVSGIKCKTPKGEKVLQANAVILGSGGFEANASLRRKIMGAKWEHVKVRGTPHNTGNGIQMALALGAGFHGEPEGCHAVPMDLHMPDYGNQEIPHIERKQYRKICYFLGVMLNSKGERFVDEGVNFRNYTYAQFGKAILNQPGNIAWQIFDLKVDHLLYEEYRFWDAHPIEGQSLEELVQKLDGMNQEKALTTLEEFNTSVDQDTPFDPTILDGRATQRLSLNKTNWANTLDTPPFKAYPVTCGITFTYGGLKVDKNAAVLDTKNQTVSGLFACGELVGGIFYNGYPGGSGLTSGAVFGRLAGYGAVNYLN